MSNISRSRSSLSSWSIRPRTRNDVKVPLNLLLLLIPLACDCHLGHCTNISMKSKKTEYHQLTTAEGIGICSNNFHFVLKNSQNHEVFKVIRDQENGMTHLKRYVYAHLINHIYRNKRINMRPTPTALNILNRNV